MDEGEEKECEGMVDDFHMYQVKLSRAQEQHHQITWHQRLSGSGCITKM